MAAIAPNTLLEEAKCYECFGPLSQGQLLKLALLRRQLLALNASAEVDAQSLFEYGKCYACLGLSIFDILEVSLLDQIAQA